MSQAGNDSTFASGGEDYLFFYLKFIFNKVHKNKHCILSIKKRKLEKGLTQGIEH